jgi:type II secretion system protein L
MASKTWGLDIGATGIKVVEVTRTLRGYRATNYGFFPFSSREKEGLQREKSQRLREILAKLEIGGENLILPMASHRTMVHRIVLPFKDRKKNQQVVKFEVESLLPIPIDQVIVDFYSPGRENKALVFALPKDELGEQVALLKDAGMDPESVVPEALTLFWLVSSLGKTSKGTGALLDLGYNKTTLIVWQDDRLALVRSIPIAGESLSKVLDQASGRSREEAIRNILARLTEEVHRTVLSFEYEEAHPVENIYLTGGVALLDGVVKILGDLLRKPVAVLNLEEGPLQDIPKELHPILAVAMGSALAGTAPARVNFRKEEFASSQKAQKVKGRLKTLISYAVILAVLGLSAFITNLYTQEKRYQDLRTEVRKEFMQALPEVKKVANEVQQMKARVQEERAKLDSWSGGTGRGSPLEIIRELSLMVDSAWRMRVTELIIDPGMVEVSGEADSFDTVNQLKSKLDRSGQFKEVQLKTARASSLENLVEFKFQMKRGA